MTWRNHPSNEELALLAGGECGALQGVAMRWHLRRCSECEDKVAEFADIRHALSSAPPPDLDWVRLGMEMRANIRVGLEAGACVRSEVAEPVRGTRKRVFAVAGAFAVVCLSVFVAVRERTPVVPVAHGTVLRATSAGLEVRSGSGSLTLLNSQGAVADQTAVAQGTIRASYIDGETGKVTVTSVYQE